jgi:hypothetical protein
VWTAIGVPLPFTITQFDAGRSWACEVGERFGSAAEALQSMDEPQQF